MWLIFTAFTGLGIDESQNQIGISFAPYAAFGLAMAVILGSLFGCKMVVFRLSHYD